MKVFLDTNVVIDFFAQREEFFLPAALIIELARIKQIEIVVSSLIFVNVAYILRKTFEKNLVFSKLNQLSALCEISSIDELVIKNSLSSIYKDFEDCIQYLSAKTKNTDVIITCNKKDFVDFPIIVFTPTEFIEKCYERFI